MPQGISDHLKAFFMWKMSSKYITSSIGLKTKSHKGPSRDVNEGPLAILQVFHT